MKDVKELKQNINSAVMEYLIAMDAARADQQVDSCVIALSLVSATDDFEVYRAASTSGTVSEAVGLSTYANAFFANFMITGRDG